VYSNTSSRVITWDSANRYDGGSQSCLGTGTGGRNPIPPGKGKGDDGEGECGWAPSGLAINSGGRTCRGPRNMIRRGEVRGRSDHEVQAKMAKPW